MTAVYETDLFGQPVEPRIDIPRRNASDYQTYLSSLPLPDGLRFWSLGPEDDLLAIHPEKRFLESIWAKDSRDRLTWLVIDLRTADRVMTR